MARLLYRVGLFAARRSIPVIVGWILLLGLASAGAILFGGTLTQSFVIPGTQSQQAIDMLDQRFPQASGGSARVIYVAPEGQQIGSFETEIDTAVAALKGVDHVSSVTGPYGADATGANVTGQVSSDGSMAFSTVQYDVATATLTAADNEALVAAGRTAETNGVTVAFSGVTDPAASDVDYTELVGLLVAFVILAITFGSLLAAGMPLVTALIGVALTSTLVTIASGFASIPSTATALALMLGLAVGIDYALFIVSRHRTQLIHGMDPKQSAAIAVSTAGSAVVFAGLTVIIALLGLSVVQIPFLTVMGIGAAVSVAIAVLVALTLLPAILGLFGRTLIPRPTSRAAKRELRVHDPKSTARTLGARWVGLVTAKPVITVAVVVIGLVIVALPALGGGLRLTIPDAGYNPPESESRQGYDLLTEGFGPGFNGPLLVTADISNTLKIDDALTALQNQFTGLADIESVSKAIPNETADMAIVSIIPESSPDSEQTQNLVTTIRDMAPAFEAANGFTYQVTGQTAVGIDVSDRLGAALLPYAIVVVGLCIVLLTIVFRSFAVPISATIGYLLSVGASFGIVTAVFEWGWLADVIGVGKVGPVISFFPILLMAVLFGLAMDYQVFLVSRMREEFVKTGDPRRAVKDGFIGAARVVTAAACIMFSVFASFVPSGSAVLQPIALGLAAGVFIDAFLVRMTLIPALMILLGRLGWALPAAFRRVLPNVDLEGEGVREMLEASAWRPLDDAGQPYSVAAENADVEGSAARGFSVRAATGDLVLVTGAASTHPDAVVAALAARQRVLSGHLRVLDQPQPFHASALRQHSSLVLRSVEPTPLDQLPAVSPRAQSALQRLRQDVGDDLAEVWGAATADEWMRDLAAACVSRSALIAIDGTGLSTAVLQRALSIVDAVAASTATIAVAHHGARLTAGVRPVQVIELRPPDPAKPPGQLTATADDQPEPETREEVNA